MENIEKCDDFVMRVYDPIHSVSGNLRITLFALINYINTIREKNSK